MNCSRHIALIISFFTIWSTSVGAQEETKFIPKVINVGPINSEIVIDGSLSEETWEQMEAYGDFWEQAPEDGQPASQETEVKIGYDEGGIYISATIFDDNGQIITTLKRDNFGDDDSFAVVFDPMNQNTHGFAFGANAHNAQFEALISPNDGDDSWDNRWRSATKIYSDRWTIEMYIPFGSLRFDQQNKSWGVNFARFDQGTNESHVWSPVPRQFDIADLGYCGELIWEEIPQGKKGNVSIIPYINSNISRDFNSDQGTQSEFNAGGDAKIALSTGMNLDLTVNPDFSQVEVDAQVTNLTRFNIFFPERRQFFIENADLFSNYGQFANQPFYSRRIGLDPSGRTVPILYGARLTGNLNEKFRIGALNMHTKTTENNPGQNFTSIAIQYRLGTRSSIKGLFLNRQAFEGSESIGGDYGRNLGGELNLSTPDGKWAGQAGYIHSMKEGVQSDNRHIYGRFDYSGERFRTFLFVQNLGENYFADMGFNARINNFDPLNNRIVRIGYTQIGNMLNYYIFPKTQKINFHWSGIENFIIINNGGLLNEWYTRFRHFIFFQNTSQLRVRINHVYNDLVFPFALTETPLPAGEYDYWEFNVQYNTDIRKTLSGSIFAIYGDFFNGTKFTYIANLDLGIQPWGNFEIGVEQNLIRLPEPYGNLDINLITARAELNFSTSLFWTTFFQYNTQAKRMNINSRLQWRYAPMSDIFLVYTDNYQNLNGLTPQDRTIVLKVNYWLGL